MTRMTKDQNTLAKEIISPMGGAPISIILLEVSLCAPFFIESWLTKIVSTFTIILRESFFGKFL